MITKKGSRGKITLELKSSGPHFKLTKNNIRGLHGSLLASEDDTSATLRITPPGAGAVPSAQDGAEVSIASSEATSEAVTASQDNTDSVSSSDSEATDIDEAYSAANTDTVHNIPLTGATNLPHTDVAPASKKAAVSITPSGVVQVHPQSVMSTTPYSKKTSFNLVPFGCTQQPIKIHVHVHVHND